MKKTWTTFVLTATLWLSIAGHSDASAGETKPAQIVFDGEVLSLGRAPVVEGTAVYAPFRPIFTRLGFTVSWDETTGYISAVRPDLQLQFKPGSNIVLVNQFVNDLGLYTKTIDGEAWVPLQQMTAAIGGRTVWNPLSQTLYVKPDVATFVSVVLQQYANRLTYEGEMQSGVRQGKGKLFLDGQLWYEGSFSQNRMEGAGKLYDRDILVYEGGFKDNLPNGHGTLYYSNGDSYVGELANGKPNGDGDYMAAGKLAYSGEWKDGTMDGLGKIVNADGKVTFQGTFVRNQRTGYGVSFSPDGKKEYEGDWKNGIRDGHGKAYDPATGKISYDGGWKNDQRDGPGYLYVNGNMDWVTTEGEKVVKKESLPTIQIQTVNYKEGVLLNKGQTLVYHGSQSDDGLPNGKGTLSYLKDKKATQAGVLNSFALRYEGNFEYGLMTGQGKLFDDNGQLVYEGALKDGIRSGQGRSYKNGVVQYEGGWDQDKENGTGRTFQYDERFTGQDFKGQASALVYEGEYKDGQLIKKGNIYKYYGEFANSKLEGYGSIVLLYDADSYNNPPLPLSGNETGKLVYEGNFSNGYRDGQGKLYKDGKLIYEGSFMEGLRHGTGKAYENDTIYEGPFFRDQKTGTGTIYDQYHHKIFYGEFQNNMKNGHGQEFGFMGNLVYDGEYKDDKRHGYGKLYRADGETIYYEGEFREGQILSDYLKSLQ